MLAVDDGSLLAEPNRSHQSVYNRLLSSSSWPPRLARLATLGEPETVAGGSHRVIEQAWGSTGCVNAMDWESGTAGLGRLASAGDDTKICIWKTGLDPASDSFSASEPVTAPRLHYGLSEVIDSGHRANIFSVKWAPHDPNRLFSCAGDSTTRVFDISQATNPALSSITVSSRGPSSSHPSWTHHEHATACTKVIRCHTGRVKRVATETSPDIFLTCSEDGTVRQHDLRTNHRCRSPGERNRSDGCPPPLVEYEGLSLYSLSLSRLRPHLFTVAGTGPYTYLHDRRMLRAPMIRDWRVEPDSSGFTQCVRRFGVPKEDGTGEISNHVVATKLSSTHARDLLVSYSGAGVYLFDTDADVETSPPVKQSERKESGRRTVPEKRAREEAEAEAEAEETSRPEQNEGEGETEASSPIGPHLSEAAQETTATSTTGEAAADSDGDSEPAHPVLSRFGRPRRRAFHPKVPLVTPRKAYFGHLNESTVKDVNFAFRDAYVVSGSDDGNFFLWDKESEELVAVYKGDSNVVNVMQPHPHLPVLAISGIDPTVKLFGPTNDVAKRANLIQEADTIIERNKARAGQDSDGDTLTAEDLVALLYSRMSPDARGRVRVAFANRNDGDGDGDGDDDDVQECTLM